VSSCSLEMDFEGAKGKRRRYFSVGDRSAADAWTCTALAEQEETAAAVRSGPDVVMIGCSRNKTRARSLSPSRRKHKRPTSHHTVTFSPFFFSSAKESSHPRRQPWAHGRSHPRRTWPGRRTGEAKQRQRKAAARIF
jgi:hypothetical protein